MPEKVVKYDSLRRYDEAIKSLIESSGGMSVDELPKFSETSITSGSALESSGQAGYMYYIGEWTSSSGMMGADYSDIRAGDLIAVTKAFDWGEMAPVEYVNLGQMPKNVLHDQYGVTSWGNAGETLTGGYTAQPAITQSGSSRNYSFADATLYWMGNKGYAKPLFDLSGVSIPDIKVSVKGVVTELGNPQVIAIPQLGDGLSFDRSTNTLSCSVEAGVWRDAKTEGEFYKADDAPTSLADCKLDGALTCTRVYNAVWSDYAELFPAAEEIPAGRVAFAGEDGLVRASGRVPVGIVSDRYGHLLGGDGSGPGDGWVPVAVAGRVPVDGAAALGDMLCARGDGTVRPAGAADFGRIVGRCVGFEGGRPVCLVGVM